MHFIPGTGEHGVGIGKKEFLVKELGEGTVGLMKTIKRAIDPFGIMNPGKVCTITAVLSIVELVAQYLNSSTQTTTLNPTPDSETAVGL